MIITQETANLIDTLAHAASQIGSTPASAKINKLIVDILPLPSDEETIADSLRLDVANLQEELAALNKTFAGECIHLSPAELQSGYDRVRWAEDLIKQLPDDHEGRNSWLANYGASTVVDAEFNDEAPF